MKNKEEGRRRKRRSARDNNGDNVEEGVGDGVTTGGSRSDQLSLLSLSRFRIDWGEGVEGIDYKPPVHPFFFVSCSVPWNMKGRGGQAGIIHPSRPDWEELPNWRTRFSLVFPCPN
jgi:hypothetical protein